MAKETKVFAKKRRFGPGVRLGQFMLGNTSLKRKIGKKDLLTYLKKVKETKVFAKKRGFGPGLGQVSLCQAIYFTKENQ